MNLQRGIKKKYRIIIGTNEIEHNGVYPIQDIERVLLSFFSGYTFTVGTGGWREDGAPYAGGGKDDNKIMIETAYIFDVVCRYDFDFEQVILALAEVIPEWFADQIMVEVQVIETMHFSAKSIRGDWYEDH